MDTQIPFFMEAVGQYSLLIFANVAMVCFLYPWFTIAFIFIFGLVILLDTAMNSGVYHCKRLDNQLKAPVLHHISSSMAGLVIIRGFAKQTVFKKRWELYLI